MNILPSYGFGNKPLLTKNLKDIAQDVTETIVGTQTVAALLLLSTFNSSNRFSKDI